MAETEENKKELKRRFQLWIRPSVLDLAQQFYKMDNCESRSEFIEKAIIFYAGYLSSNKNDEYLPNIITSSLKSIVKVRSEATRSLHRHRVFLLLKNRP